MTPPAPAPLNPVPVRESPESKFREYLEIRGEKLTRSRRQLVNHIFNSHKHFDADELSADLLASGVKVSRATVYRTLRLLVDAGLLRELRLTNRSAFEHAYGYPSHDHLYCSNCEAVIEFNNDEVRQIREVVGRQHGFRPDNHRFVITGLCANCLKGRGRRPDGLNRI